MHLINPVDRPLSRLFDYLKPHKRNLWSSVTFSFFNKLLDLAPPVLVGWAVDTVNRKPPPMIQWLSGAQAYSAVLWLGVLGFLIFAFESFFQWLYTRGFMNLAQEVQHSLRMESYEKMQTREMAFFENHRVGETMSMLSDDVNQLERFLNSVFNDIVQLIALFLIAGSILFDASPTLSLIAILPMPLIIWGALSFQKVLYPRYQKVREAVSHLNTRLENNLAGIAIIKAFNAESYESSRMNQVSLGYRDANHQAIELSSLFTPLIRMGVALGFAGVLWVGGLWTIDGTITVGTYTLFAMMCQRILWPLTSLGRILDETERCRASSARIFGLIDTPSKIVDTEKPDSLRLCKGQIEFKEVFFRYPEGPLVVKGLNLHISAGEKIGIVGATGAGKSTIVKLLLRFYEPEAGSISIDNFDIDDLTLKELRDHIALVSQDVYLFQGTILENITYGMGRAVSFEAIVAAAQKAKLHDFIESLPRGYETLVGERGIKLSGGQRQRLSIARALIKNAPIIILDEATSSVDTETERAIQENLDLYTKGRTAIMIAHRLSTIRHADRIFVLQNGAMIEQGDHKSLLSLNGVYADLWAFQSGKLKLV